MSVQPNFAVRQFITCQRSALPLAIGLAADSDEIGPGRRIQWLDLDERAQPRARAVLNEMLLAVQNTLPPVPHSCYTNHYNAAG